MPKIDPFKVPLIKIWQLTGLSFDAQGMLVGPGIQQPPASNSVLASGSALQSTLGKRLRASQEGVTPSSVSDLTTEETSKTTGPKKRKPNQVEATPSSGSGEVVAYSKIISIPNKPEESQEDTTQALTIRGGVLLDKPRDLRIKDSSWIYWLEVGKCPFCTGKRSQTGNHMKDAHKLETHEAVEKALGLVRFKVPGNGRVRYGKPRLGYVRKGCLTGYVMAYYTKPEEIQLPSSFWDTEEPQDQEVQDPN